MVLRAIGDITVADAAGHAGDIRGAAMASRPAE